MTTLKVGLIGCGHIAQRAHLINLKASPCAELVAFAETETERRQATARLVPKATAFASYEEMLDRADVEAVVICLPNALHATAAIAALERGKHIYLEKPLAMNIDEARAVIRAWRSAGVVAMMGFNYRFNKLYESAREHVHAGTLGQTLYARSVFSTALQDLPSWKQSRRSGGGVLFDLASHHFDLLRYFFGREVSEVCAEIQSHKSEGDNAFVQMRLADGTTAQSFFSTSAVEEDSFEIYGEKAKLSIDRYSSLEARITPQTLDGLRVRQLRHGLKSLSGSRYLLEKMRAPLHEPSYRAALSRFVSAAQTNAQLGPDLFDGYQSLALIEAAEESARTRRWIQLKQQLTEVA
ncbi:MAG: myo-inositol 2-dehydrogenase / D-chiro-inositol 1-dehydrogenase [Acidobacteriota bacterium]|nr:myo-inositol 2-dehydrogenase / D-chiro-inositol 1-dehydrogenase [Acidobacteriota bacterium]